MKKRLSLLMVLMMVLSLVPMSAFATAGTVPGGVISVEDNEKTVEKVTVRLTQAAYDSLKTGDSRLTLDGASFARVVAAADVDDATQAGNYTNRHVITFNSNNATGAGIAQNTTGAIVPVMSDVATVYVPGNITVAADDMDMLLELYLQFDQEDVGDVTLSIQEVDKTALKVADPIKVAVVKAATSTDLNLAVTDSAKKIGLDGGALSRIEIKGFDKSTLATDSFKLELPEYLKWKNTTNIQGIGGAASPSTAFGSDVLEITVAAGTKSVIIEPVVDVQKRDAAMGDVTVKVISRDASAKQIDSTSEVIGQLVDYDVTMTAVEAGKKEIPSIYGNDKATVRVKLSGVAGSFTDGRTIDFTVEGADVTFGSVAPKKTISAVTSISATKDSIGDKDGNSYEDGEFTLTLDNTATGAKTVEFEMEITTDYAHNGEVVLTADSRDFGTLECEIAKVTPAFTVEVENVTTIKKGESLATADVVIKEAKAGIFDSNEYLVLNLNDKNRETLSFASDYTVEGTNGLKLGDGIYNEQGGNKNALSTLVIDIKSSSVKEAGVITISDVVVNVDGATVDGVKTLDVYVVEDDFEYNFNNATPPVAQNDVDSKATAVEYIADQEPDADYEVEYINVVKEYGTVATTTVFVIGSKTYTVNGVQMTANEAPYVAGKGYTMLPVRALAESLGLKADWNSNTKTATFSNDSKVASVTLGADTMYVNGTPIPLNAKAEIKNGSTFIELRSLASAFGVELQWDAATKTVTIVG